MIRCLRTLQYAGRTALALLALTALPMDASAGWLGVRNDTNTAVVVQVSHLINNQPRPGKPHLLLQGNVTWERITQPGNKVITLYDPKQPTRILPGQPFPCVGTDLFFSIQFGPTPPARPGEKPGPPQFKLVETKPPDQVPKE